MTYISALLAGLVALHLLPITNARSFGVNKRFHTVRPDLPPTIYTLDASTNPLIGLPFEPPNLMVDYVSPKPFLHPATFLSNPLDLPPHYYTAQEPPGPLLTMPQKRGITIRRQSLRTRQHDFEVLHEPPLPAGYGGARFASNPGTAAGEPQTQVVSDTTIALLILFGLLVLGVTTWAIAACHRTRKTQRPIIRRLDIELGSPTESDTTPTAAETEKHSWSQPSRLHLHAPRGHSSAGFVPSTNGFLQVPTSSPHGRFFQSIRSAHAPDRRRNGVVSPPPDLPRPMRAVLDDVRTPEQTVCRRTSRSNLRLAAIVEDMEDGVDAFTEPVLFSTALSSESEHQLLASFPLPHAALPPLPAQAITARPDSSPIEPLTESSEHVEFPQPTHAFASHRVKAQSIALMEASAAKASTNRWKKAMTLQSPAQIRELKVKLAPLVTIDINRAVPRKPATIVERKKRAKSVEATSTSVQRTDHAYQAVPGSPSGLGDSPSRPTDTPGASPVSPLQSFFDELTLSRSPNSSCWRESSQSALSNHSQESDLSSPPRPESPDTRYCDILASAADTSAETDFLEELVDLELLDESDPALRKALEYSSRLSLDSEPSFGMGRVDRGSVASFASGMTFDKVYEELLAGYVDEGDVCAAQGRASWTGVPDITVTEH